MPPVSPLLPTPITIADQVAADLTDLIAHGEFAPGDRLPGERQLAERMGVSRVSVRAALQKLKAQGLIQSVQGGGTRVMSTATDLSEPLSLLVRSRRENLQDLAEIRLSLESWAARRAAERATPEIVAELQETVDTLRAAGAGKAARETVAAADVNFHLAIGKAADSPVYLHMLSTIRDVLVGMLSYHRYELFTGKAGDEAVIDQHSAILAAIKAGDPDGAEAAMRAHLNWVLRHYESLPLPADRPGTRLAS